MITSKAAFNNIGSRKNIATAKYPNAHDKTIYCGSGHARWSPSFGPPSNVTLSVFATHLEISGDRHVNCIN